MCNCALKYDIHKKKSVYNILSIGMIIFLLLNMCLYFQFWMLYNNPTLSLFEVNILTISEQGNEMDEHLGMVSSCVKVIHTHYIELNAIRSTLSSFTDSLMKSTSFKYN